MKNTILTLTAVLFSVAMFIIGRQIQKNREEETLKLEQEIQRERDSLRNEILEKDFELKENEVKLRFIDSLENLDETIYELEISKEITPSLSKLEWREHLYYQTK